MKIFLLPLFSALHYGLCNCPPLQSKHCCYPALGFLDRKFSNLPQICSFLVYLCDPNKYLSPKQSSPNVLCYSVKQSNSQGGKPVFQIFTFISQKSWNIWKIHSSTLNLYSTISPALPILMPLDALEYFCLFSSIKAYYEDISLPLNWFCVLLTVISFLPFLM
jgi:hypothetical protein